MGNYLIILFLDSILITPIRKLVAMLKGVCVS